MRWTSLKPWPWMGLALALEASRFLLEFDHGIPVETIDASAGLG